MKTPKTVIRLIDLGVESGSIGMSGSPLIRGHRSRGAKLSEPGQRVTAEIAFAPAAPWTVREWIGTGE
jgi:hypothetical protein